MQNLLTYLEEFITPERKERFTQTLAQRTSYFTVAVEDVFQMHNSSAIVRSCDIFGVQNAHFIEKNFGKKIDRNIAMGAQKWVTIHRYTSTEECLHKLRGEGYQIVATTPHHKASPIEEFDITKKSAFFFGTERTGLSEQVLKNADTFLTIPMVGFTESLNISVSVAIILQSLTQRLRNSRLPWQLSQEEELLTRLAWTKNSIRNLDFILKRYYQ